MWALQAPAQYERKKARGRANPVGTGKSESQRPSLRRRRWSPPATATTPLATAPAGRRREAGSARRRRSWGPSATARRFALLRSGCRRARAWSRTQPTERLRCARRSRWSASSTAPFCTSIFSRKCVGEMVENGVIPVLPALVKRSEAPPLGEGDSREKFHRREVEKTSEVLGSIAVESEHQHDSDNIDAISYLRSLLKRHEAGFSSPSANGLVVRAANTVTELVLGIGNGNADVLVRMVVGIPLFVELQGAALCVMASKNEENRNQIVHSGALPSIVLLLKSDNADIHIKAVALIGVPVFLNANVEKDVLAAGGLQPIVRLLRHDYVLGMHRSRCLLLSCSSCVWSQMEATRLVRQFAAAKSVRKAIVWRGAVRPLIEML
ncbi:ARM REPEAT PROTEIN INTERACTING WITH ABF2-like [Eucalyptus grandis]|uniref:ARM REPEAT PROTEIN INTERACTING WITH ABF2-like n=1 Tax=Eucalyptus grandis TaxID=71139 RepID=UPI00192E9AE6|nr:ARM REPEAT PROTEIN INTERACTING WITH ABF2-like [Eucalyptus grandis]